MQEDELTRFARLLQMPNEEALRLVERCQEARVSLQTILEETALARAQADESEENAKRAPHEAQARQFTEDARERRDSIRTRAWQIPDEWEEHYKEEDD